MGDKKVKILVIGREEMFSKASDLIFDLGEQSSVPVEVDCVTTGKIATMFFKKKYDKIILFLPGPKNKSFEQIAGRIFKKEKTKGLVVSI